MLSFEYINCIHFKLMNHDFTPAWYWSECLALCIKTNFTTKKSTSIRKTCSIDIRKRSNLMENSPSWVRRSIVPGCYYIWSLSVCQFLFTCWNFISTLPMFLNAIVPLASGLCWKHLWTHHWGYHWKYLWKLMYVSMYEIFIEHSKNWKPNCINRHFQMNSHSWITNYKFPF